MCHFSPIHACVCSIAVDIALSLTSTKCTHVTILLLQHVLWLIKDLSLSIHDRRSAQQSCGCACACTVCMVCASSQLQLPLSDDRVMTSNFERSFGSLGPTPAILQLASQFQVLSVSCSTVRAVQNGIVDGHEEFTIRALLIGPSPLLPVEIRAGNLTLQVLDDDSEWAI